MDFVKGWTRDTGQSTQDRVEGEEPFILQAVCCMGPGVVLCAAWSKCGIMWFCMVYVTCLLLCGKWEMWDAVL